MYDQKRNLAGCGVCVLRWSKSEGASGGKGDDCEWKWDPYEGERVKVVTFRWVTYR